jgi:hypothetical protein
MPFFSFRSCPQTSMQVLPYITGTIFAAVCFSHFLLVMSLAFQLIIRRVMLLVLQYAVVCVCVCVFLANLMF